MQGLHDIVKEDPNAERKGPGEDRAQYALSLLGRPEMQKFSPEIKELVKTAPPFNPVQRDVILSAFLGLDTVKR